MPGEANFLAALQIIIIDIVVEIGVTHHLDPGEIETFAIRPPADALRRRCRIIEKLAVIAAIQVHQVYRRMVIGVSHCVYYPFAVRGNCRRKIHVAALAGVIRGQGARCAQTLREHFLPVRVITDIEFVFPFAPQFGIIAAQRAARRAAYQERPPAPAVFKREIGQFFASVFFCDESGKAAPEQIGDVPIRKLLSVVRRMADIGKVILQHRHAQHHVGCGRPVASAAGQFGFLIHRQAFDQPDRLEHVGKIQVAEYVLQHFRKTVHHIHLDNVRVFVGDQQPHPVVIIAGAENGFAVRLGDEERDQVIGQRCRPSIGVVKRINKNDIGAFMRLRLHTRRQPGMHVFCKRGHPLCQSFFSLVKMDQKMRGTQRVPGK